MAYTLCISKDGEIIVQLGVSADEALAAVGRAIPKTADIPEPPADLPPSRRGRKPGKQGKREYKQKPADSEMMQDAARRHPATEQIEEMLIEGMSVPAILEKVEVSGPTVYVIRTRLRKEGRLSE